MSSIGVGPWAADVTQAGISSSEAITMSHAKPEFFVRGVGWVPLEATAKMDIGPLFGINAFSPMLIKSVEDDDGPLDDILPVVRSLGISSIHSELKVYAYSGEITAKIPNFQPSTNVREALKLLAC